MAPVSQLMLYTNPRTRGSIVEWYLKELGVHYERVFVDMEKKEHKEDWYIKIHPLGKLPAMQDGELTLCQSAAMMLYIADKHDVRVKTPEDRALCAQWVLFANTDLADLLFRNDLPESYRDGVLGYLETRLAAHPFVAGEEFTVGDAAVGAHLLFFKVFLPQLSLEKWPAVAAYVKRMSARPACEATVMQGVNADAGK